MKLLTRQHVLFWIGYLTWDVLQAVISLSGPAGGLSPDPILALYTSLLLLIPKIILFYCIYIVALKPLITKKQSAVLSVLYATIATVTTLMLYRGLMFYVIFPKIYRVDMSAAHFFHLSSLVISLFDLLVAVFLLIIYELYRYTKSSKERERRLEQEKLLSELNYLKAQINPHFLFNVLSSVHALSRNKAPEAADVTLRLSKLMRFMLFEAKRTTIGITEEIKILEDYIELEKVRFSSKLTVKFEKSIDNEALQIAPLVLLPFVENAFKHGPGESRFQSFVNINLSVNNGMLVFEVKNSVEESYYSDDSTNTGLANIKRRLELIYPGYQLKLEREQNVFLATLKFKLLNHE